MNKYLKFKELASGILALGAGPTFAHENHGLYGSHWHATDVIGFVVAAVARAIAFWYSVSGK
jgi:hypothetical protein